ncbi:hypothetical protein [Nitrospira sp. M1]
MTPYFESQRKDLLNKQKERKKREEIQRLRRLPKGFKALWFHMTGKYQKIKAQNEREAKSSAIRDRGEKQALIDRVAPAINRTRI